jgi:hypothetical protein
MGRYRLPDGPSPAEHDRLVVGPVPRSPDDEDDAAAMREMWLAAWVRTSLLGILLGLGLAKYARAWVGDTLLIAVATTLWLDQSPGRRR